MANNEKLIDDLYWMGEEIYKKYNMMKTIRQKIIELNKQGYTFIRRADQSWDASHDAGFSVMSLPNGAATMFCYDALEVISYCNELDLTSDDSDNTEDDDGAKDDSLQEL